MSGRSLLYCYCDVLQCTVRAPVELISEDDFDNEGKFTGKAAAIEYSPTAGPTFVSQATGVTSSIPVKTIEAKSTKLEIDRFVNTVLPIPDAKARALELSIEVLPVTWKKLASATREVTLRLKGGRTLYVVDRGRYVVTADGDSYQVVAPDQLVAALFRALWR